MEHLGILELEQRCRHHGWLAERLFEVVGSWTASAETGPERIAFAEMVTDWARHGADWAERMPDLTRYRTSPEAADDPHPRAAAIVALADEGPTLLGRRALGEILDAWIGELTVWRDDADPDLDAPTFHLLERCIADLIRHRHRLEGVLAT